MDLLDGKAIPVEEFLKRLEQTIDYRYHKPECGFLFQDPLKLAPEIESLTGWAAICGLRIICLNERDGVKPIRALWKVAVPPNYMDNFHMGKYGNLIADIDLATGEVFRLIDGFWPRTKLLSSMPHTGVSLAGFKLPGWSQLLETCQSAAAVFPLMRIHHWDFALTDRGPIILELNDIGGTEGMQVHGNGLLTEETREFLKQHASVAEHPWVRAL
jgi:hypothetical protein